MPYDGTGIYTRLYSWVDEASDSDPRILSHQLDADGDDIADALSLALLRDGRAAATANIDLGSNKIVNLADPENEQDAATKDYVDNKVFTSDNLDLNTIDFQNIIQSPNYRLVGRILSGTGDLDFLSANDFATFLAQITTALSLNSQRLTSVADPTLAQDAATKAYVDGASFDTGNLDDEAITNAKLADVSQWTWKGRVASGSGVPGDLSANDLLALIGQATNDISMQGSLQHPTYNGLDTAGYGIRVDKLGAVSAQRASGAADSDLMFGARRGTDLNARINADGSMYNATGTYGTISTILVKRDIEDMGSVLEKICATKLKQYRLKDDVDRNGESAAVHEGPIAENLLANGFSDLVSEFGGLLHVDLVGIGLKSWRAIQEMMGIIEKLEQKVRDLEGR